MEPDMLDPALRHGLLGFCGLQLAVGAWLLKIVLAIARDLARVVDANTAAVAQLARRGDELAPVARDLRDRLLTRPCLLNAGKREDG